MENRKLSIMAVGDISPGDHYFSLGHGVRSSFEQHGCEHIFGKVVPRLREADITFGNLEGPISDIGRAPGSFRSVAFRGNPKFAQCLGDAGFNVLNVANNHILQHGVEAFNNTIERLSECHIDVVGIKDRCGRCQPVIRSVRGTVIGFLGYSLVKEQYAAQTLYADQAPKEILSEVRRLRAMVDVLIVSCHFGVEGADEPARDDVEFARSVIAAGADILLGHHPHVMQNIERYRGGLIVYSLGNFLFDLFWNSSYRSGAIVEIQICGGGKIDYKLHPVAIGRKCEILCVEAAKAGGQNTNGYWGWLAKREGVSKALYIFGNIWRGRTFLKLGFIGNKIMEMAVGNSGRGG